MYYCAHLICKACVYKLFSELFLATSCLLYADTVPLKFMASGSQLKAETDTDIVVLSETTESTSATRQLPSLLDKLKCPTKSDFCRKRKVKERFKV